MNTFRKWNGKKIEDWGSIQSDDAKAFYRAFKNYLKRTFPDCELIGFKPNHYDFSGFIHQGDNYIYVSHSIDRSKERVDFNDSSVMSGVLYRTAEGPKDYRGGQNNFCSLYKLEDCIKALFAKMEKQKVEAGVKINEKLYSQSEIQDMLTKCKKDKKLADKILGQIKDKSDKLAVKYVLSTGFAEDFTRYDSMVCDKFISAYEKYTTKGQKEYVELAVDKVLEGYKLTDVILL